MLEEAAVWIKASKKEALWQVQTQRELLMAKTTNENIFYILNLFTISRVIRVKLKVIKFKKGVGGLDN